MYSLYMNTMSVTGILREYKIFDREFWLSYKTLEKLLPPDQFNLIKIPLMRTKQVKDEYLQGINKQVYETERQLLDAEWKEKSNEAKEAGIKLHDTLHNMFCTNLAEVQTTFGIDTESYHVKATEAFLNTDKGIFPEFRMEIPLDDDYCLVGIADLIIKDGNDITIIDWKSSDKISSKSRYDLSKKRDKTFKYPINHLQDCDLVQFQLQISMYAWMLQQMNPEFNIKTLKIIQVKDFKVKHEYIVEYLKKDVDKLITWHLKNTKLQIEMQKCREIEY